MLCCLIAVVVGGTPDIGEEVTEKIEAEVDHEEDSSCTRLLAAAAERVWDIFLQNKREVRFYSSFFLFSSLGSSASPWRR